MRYEDCDNYIQFYSNNPNKVSLLILKETGDDGEVKVKGRALVWSLSIPENRHFMDRIYYVDESDVDSFKTYARKNGWFHKVEQNSSSYHGFMDTKTDKIYKGTLIVNDFEESPTQEYPYMDTLSYYSVGLERLSDSTDVFGSSGFWTLEDTGGGYSDGREYNEYYDDYFDEGYLEYCEFGDDCRTPEDAIWIDYYGKNATSEYVDDNMIDCDYYDGDSSYRLENDTVEIYGNDKIACKEYADNHLDYSDYVGGYLDDKDSVWSDYHNTSLYKPESTKVYTNPGQSKTDWRADNDDTWWTWDYDGEDYSNSVTEEELREYNDVNEDE